MWRETIELEKLEDEEVLLQSRTSIDKSAEPKNCGYLHLTNKRIVWTQAAQPKPMINIPFSEITKFDVDTSNARLAMDTKATDQARHIFNFLEATRITELTGDVLRQLCPHLNQDKKKPQGKYLNAEQVKICRQRADILARNAELRLLHSELVPKVISEEDFWKSRSDMLEKSTVEEQQQIGLSSSTIKYVRRATTQESNVQTLRLTPQIIHHIFVENPSLRKIYEAVVPHKRTEEEFWQDYYQSKAKHEYCDYLSFPEDVYEAYIQLDLVDPSIDLSKEDDKDIYSYSGSVSKSSILHDYNNHSNIVLANSFAPPAPPVKQKNKLKRQIGKNSAPPVKRFCASLSSQIELTDLKEEIPIPTAPLLITDQRLYFQSSNVITRTPEEKQAVMNTIDEFNFANGAWQATFSAQPDINLKVLGNVESLCSSRTNGINGEAYRDEIPNEIKDELHKTFLKANELLRHFWGTFPITNPRLVNKAKSLYVAISKFYDELHDRILELQRSPNEYFKELSRLLSPIRTSIDKAITFAQATLDKSRH